MSLWIGSASHGLGDLLARNHRASLLEVRRGNGSSCKGGPRNAAIRFIFVSSVLKEYSDEDCATLLNCTGDNRPREVRHSGSSQACSFSELGESANTTLPEARIDLDSKRHRFRREKIVLAYWK